MAEALIQLQDVCKSYDMGAEIVHALRGVSLQITRGEYVAIMGPSGSGKSTLMNILGCLDRPTEGKYYLEGIDVSEKTDDELSEIRNRKIGFVFQSFNLIPRTSALQNVELPMIYGKVPAQERLETALSLLDQVGLADRARHMPNELSGGQKQRVAIARALANRPQIILADEPTGNLDRHTAEGVFELLLERARSGRTSLIIVTHDQALAARTGRTLSLEDGQLI